MSKSARACSCLAQTYVNGYNAALEKLEGAQARGDTPTIVALQGAIKFNGGGETPQAAPLAQSQFQFWGWVSGGRPDCSMHPCHAACLPLPDYAHPLAAASFPPLEHRGT
jgi:hypothetical protein